MHPPVLVLRDSGQTITVELSSLFAMQRAARHIMAAALRGDEDAKQCVEAVFAIALSQDASRGHAVISAYLLREALAEISAAREAAKQPSPQEPDAGPSAQPEQAAQQAPVSRAVCADHPPDVACERCYESFRRPAKTPRRPTSAPREG